MESSIYTSLEEAGTELQKRRLDFDLIQRVEEELGDKLIPQLKAEPRAVVFKQLSTPDRGFVSFYERAQKIGIDPISFDYHQDLFVSFNEEKKGLGRLRVFLEDGTRATADIIDFFANEKKQIGEIALKNGKNLIEFHHELFPVGGYSPSIVADNSKWFKMFNRASDYYYYLLLHFVCHGVLFETFIIDPEDKEGEFTRSIVLPAIQRIKDKFGVTPIVVRQYPDEQSNEEDFYWWTYPEKVNEYFLKYIKENNFSFKKTNF